MKSLFNPSDNSDLVARISRLTPASQSQWGKMSAAQMLAHSKSPFQVAFGEVKLKRSLMGILFGTIAKKKLLNDTPFGKNLPTDKNFVVADHRNFEDEKKALISLVQRFTQAGPEGISKDPHPFFGKLTSQE